MTVAEAIGRGEAQLAEAGIDNPRLETLLLLEGLLTIPRSLLPLERARVLTEVQRETLESWLKQRAARKPLQHILGTAAFYGLELKVTPDVLIPRPETETLVAVALEYLKPTRQPRVLDIGTGSGAIALALKHERPDAVVMATDISENVLTVAQENAARLELDVAFVLSDLLEHPAVATFARTAGMFLSNPPYLPETDRATVSAEVQADPQTALYSGADGLEHYRRLERQAHALLKAGAWVLLELDPRNVRSAQASAADWQEALILPDLLHRERFLCLKR